MKKLIITTALVASMATGAHATQYSTEYRNIYSADGTTIERVDVCFTGTNTCDDDENGLVSNNLNLFNLGDSVQFMNGTTHTLVESNGTNTFTPHAAETTISYSLNGERTTTVTAGGYTISETTVDHPFEFTGDNLTVEDGYDDTAVNNRIDTVESTASNFQETITDHVTRIDVVYNERVGNVENTVDDHAQIISDLRQGDVVNSGLIVDNQNDIANLDTRVGTVEMGAETALTRADDAHDRLDNLVDVDTVRSDQEILDLAATVDTDTVYDDTEVRADIATNAQGVEEAKATAGQAQATANVARSEAGAALTTAVTARNKANANSTRIATAEDLIRQNGDLITANTGRTIANRESIFANQTNIARNSAAIANLSREAEKAEIRGRAHAAAGRSLFTQQNSVGVGLGYANGSTVLGIGVNKQYDARTNFNGSVTVDSRGDYTVGAGVSFKF